MEQEFVALGPRSRVPETPDDRSLAPSYAGGATSTDTPPPRPSVIRHEVWSSKQPWVSQNEAAWLDERDTAGSPPAPSCTAEAKTPPPLALNLTGSGSAGSFLILRQFAAGRPARACARSPATTASCTRRWPGISATGSGTPAAGRTAAPASEPQTTTGARSNAFRLNTTPRATVALPAFCDTRGQRKAFSRSVHACPQLTPLLPQPSAPSIVGVPRLWWKMAREPRDPSAGDRPRLLGSRREMPRDVSGLWLSCGKTTSGERPATARTADEIFLKSVGSCFRRPRRG